MDRCQITWKDAQGRRMRSAFFYDPAQQGAAFVELLAALDDIRALSQAQIEEVNLVVALDISGLTNGAPVSTGSFDAVNDKAVMQWDKDVGAGVISFTIPAPIDALFLASGPHALQDVDGAYAGVTALAASLGTSALLVTSEGSPVTFRKGWREGQPHS